MKTNNAYIVICKPEVQNSEWYPIKKAVLEIQAGEQQCPNYVIYIFSL